MGRALALYEVGDRQEAIAEMEDVSISLKGYPGISERYISKTQDRTDIFCLKLLLV